ncbi:MAG: CHASE2 domain-containing protein, partial [Phormidesmis sp.]
MAITVLQGPNREAFNQELWDERGWDILFFAGHSQSRPSEAADSARGEILLNECDRLTIPQLKHALKKAIDRGLNTAIFNSCDGLGLANDLADLHIPQVLVMREPVPDQVAHAFLKGFLRSFATGTAFYVAVREAREQLQGLESRFPCATWLPVIVQNLAEMPPTWRSLQGKREAQPVVERASLHVRSFHQGEQIPGELRRSVRVPDTGRMSDEEREDEERELDKQGRLTQAESQRREPSKERMWAIAASLSVAVLVLAMRFLGLLAPAELRLYDLLLRSRPAESSDPRLLIITNTQTDMDAMPSDREGVSLSDEALSAILTKLTPQKPKIIGLDIYRDFSASSSRLAQQLRETNNLIAICKAETETDDRIFPPPEIEDVARIGISDFVGEGPYEDMVRRHLVRLAPVKSTANPIANSTANSTAGPTAGPTAGATAQTSASDPAACQMPATFSMAIAFRYLKEIKNIPVTDDNVLGGARLPYIRRASFGGYADVDTRSDQLLLNYRIVKQPAQTNCGDVYETPATCLSVGDLLARPPDQLQLLVENKIVLIGTTAAGRDPWITPYTKPASGETPGVFLQAQMISQLVSAALEERSLISSMTLWQEILWTCAWAAVGGGIGLSVGFLKFGLRLLLAEGLLVLATWVWLSMLSVWVPLLPSA